MSLPSPSPDRTALVTGASSGIGVEIARELARRGQHLTLVARSGDKLRELADELSSGGVRVEVVPADLAERSARAALVSRLEELGLAVNILVNNAGLSTMGPVHRCDPDAELHMVEVDVAAVVDLCSRLLPGMVDRGTGAILTAASTAAFQPIPGQAGYGASKAFVLSYTRALAGELRGSGVTATALCPGPVQTGFGAAAGITQEQAESALPSFMWESAEAVARCGVDALAAGRGVVVPGTANRVAAALATASPKRLLVSVMASRHPMLKK